jgi:hypothetical protein
MEQEVLLQCSQDTATGPFYSQMNPVQTLESYLLRSISISFPIYS